MSTRQGAAAGGGHRIAVANFDAVEQTRTWLTLGAEQATATLLGALRTALLLADTVVVDRNQVLEGIFFIVMGPDRLAWHLGLPPGAPLPLTVGLLNPGPGPASLTAPGPWPGSSGPMWAVDDDVVEEVDLNYEAVAGDRLRVSSPLVALTGAYDGSIGAGTPSVNAPEPTVHWERTDPGFLPQAVWERRDPVLARSLIDDGRAAWITAMKSGRVAVERWRRAPIDIGLALERGRVSDPLAVDLAEAILRLEERGGLTGSCRARHAWHAVPPSDARCTVPHVTKRSLLVRWLDGETVDELVPSRLPDDLAARHDHQQRVAAFRWWNAGYYEAICARDDLRLLTLHTVLPPHTRTDPSVGATPGEVELQHRVDLAWGLSKEPESRWRTARSRLSRRTVRSGGAISVEGEIVEQLVACSPHQFVQLQHHDVVDPDRLWTAPSNRAMYDLALAVRDLAGERTSRTAQLAINLVRVVAVIAFAVTFAMRDAGFLPDSGALWATTWISLAVVAAFPWGDVTALFRMSGGELQSTLRLRDDR